MLKKRKLIPGYNFNTPEYLIKEARKIYPKGTRYICAENPKHKPTVNGDFSFYAKEEYSSLEDSISDGYGGYVYFDGKWADKI